jgi:hypothetical protein
MVLVDNRLEISLLIDDDELWMLIGDFNFYRYAENKNKAGGNFQDSLIFNNIISHLGLIELPIKGRSYTWSNMQDVPPLSKLTGSLPLLLGLVFSPFRWSFLFLGSRLTTYLVESRLAPASPRPIFLDLKIFSLTILSVWSKSRLFGSLLSMFAIVLMLSVPNSNFFAEPSSYGPKNLYNLSKLIANCNLTVDFFDRLEEIRALYPTESKFRDIIKEHIIFFFENAKSILEAEIHSENYAVWG